MPRLWTAAGGARRTGTMPAMSPAAPTDALYHRALAALLDTSRCPACTAALPGARCPVCGLDVGVPEAALLWRDSVAAADALRRREERIAAMRAVAAAPVVRAVVPGAVPVPPASAAPGPSVPAVGGVPAGSAAVPAGATGPGSTGATAPRPGASAAGAACPAPAWAAPAGPAAPRPTGAVPAGAVPTGAVPTGAVPAGAVPVGAASPVPAGAGPAAMRHGAPPVGRPRAPWRVQTVLQVVGAALLVAASATFLLFAWDVLTLGARAAVVGAGTLVVFALATVLRRRGLPQGAEAVGALAAALLLLDAWALRATGVVVVGDGAGQATASVLVCALVLAGWGAGARLRAGTVTAAALLPVAPLVWLGHAPTPDVIALLLLAASALTLTRTVRPWRTHEPDVVLLRGVAVATAVPAVLVAGGTALVRGAGSDLGLAGATLALACAVLVAHAAADAGPGPDLAADADVPGGRGVPHGVTGPTGGAPRLARVWAAVAGATGTGAVATVAAAGAGALGAHGAAAGHAAVLVAALAVAALLGARGSRAAAAERAPAPPQRLGAAWRTALPVATLTAAALAAGSAAWVLGALVTALVLPVRPAVPAALLGVAALAAAVVLAGRAAHRWPRSAVAARAGRAVAAVLGAVAVPVLVLAAVAPSAGGSGPSAAAVAGEALVVAGAVLLGARRPAWRPAARAGTLAAAAVGVAAGAAAPAWLAAALAVATAAAVHARTWGRGAGAAAVSTAAAGALALLTGTALATALGVSAASGAGVAAAVVVAGLLVRAGRRAATPLERHAAAVTAAGVATCGWLAGAAGLVAARSAAGGPVGGVETIAPLVAAAAAGAVVVALLADVAARGSRAVAAGTALAAPVAALAVVTVRACLGVPSPVAVALLVVAVGAASVLAAHLALPRGGPAARSAAEVVGWSVLACGALASVLGGPVVTAGALAVGAATAAGWAVHPDRRRAWWWAWVLGSAAWCVALGAAGAGPLEPYLVPPGLVLVAVGAVRLRRGRGGGAPLVAGGAALATLPTAVLPAVLVVGDRWVDRALLTTGLAAAVAVVALVLARRRTDGDGRRAAGALAALTAALALLGPGRRAPARTGVPWELRAPDGSALVEPWAVAAAVLLVLAATAALRSAPRTVRAVVAVLAPWGVLAVAAGPTLLVALAAAGPDGRATTTTAVRLGVLAVAAAGGALVGAATGRRTPRAGADRRGGPGVADLALALTTATAVVASALVPVAVVDTPAAVLALTALTAAAVGTRRRRRVPPWWLAVGVVALVPTLLVRTGDVRPAAWTAGAALLLLLVRVARPRAAGPDGRTATAAPVVDGTDALPPSPEPRVDDDAAPDDDALAPPAPTGPVLADAPLVVATLAAASAGVAVLGPGVAALAAATSSGPAHVLAVELPALAVAVLVALAARVAARGGLRSPWSRAAVLALVAVPVLLAADATPAGALRAGAVLALGAVVAVAGRGRHDERLGLVVAAAACGAAALRGGPEPGEVPVVLVGLLAVALGTRRLHRDPVAGSWAALGAPVAVTLAAPLTALLLAPTPWRTTTTLVLALVATVVGAVRRLQAPFVLGAAAALTAAALLLTPLAATALARVDGWVLLAVGGATVLALGLTYERRVREAREAVRVVAAMR